MSLGPSALTAFFTPLSASAKRKGHPSASTRKTKVARKDESPAGPSSLQKGKAKDKQELKQKKLSFGDNKATESTSSDPSTPSFAKGRKAITLQTPPASVDVGPRLKARLPTKRTRAPSPSRGSVTTDNTSYLPTPATKPRLKARATANSLHAAAETPCKYPPGTSASRRPSLLSRHTSPDEASSDVFIPSSQSQPDLMEMPLNEELSAAGDGEEPEQESPEPSSPEPDIPEPDIPEPESPEPSQHREYFPRDDLRLPVESSQSQFLVPFQLSPRKKRGDGTSSGLFYQPTEIFDTVPSSQSYEKELQIPTATAADSLPRENVAPRQIPPSAWAFGKNKVPPRTLSDEMFPVPISSIVDDLFEDDEDVDQPPENIPTTSGVQGGEDLDIETETDSDDGWPYFPRPLVPVSNPPPGNQAHEEVPEDPPEDPALLSQASNNEYDPDSSQNADDSPSSSLPSVLQEFRDMFGSSDESYPPDFPMSLRS